jgi:hypothetical protein
MTSSIQNEFGRERMFLMTSADVDDTSAGDVLTMSALQYLDCRTCTARGQFRIYTFLCHT